MSTLRLWAESQQLLKMADPGGALSLPTRAVRLSKLQITIDLPIENLKLPVM